MEETVQCRVCGRQLKSITPSHLKGHGLTIDGYLAAFPDASMRSEATYAKLCSSMAIANADQEKRRSQSAKMSGENNPFFGKSHTELVKQVLSANASAQWSRDYDRLSALRKSTARRGDQHHNWKGGYRDGGRKFRIRNACLNLYGCDCMIPECGFDFLVHTHHIIPRNEGGPDTTDNCILLCPNHHAMADAGKLSRVYLQGLIDEWKMAQK